MPSALKCHQIFTVWQNQAHSREQKKTLYKNAYGTAAKEEAALMFGTFTWQFYALFFALLILFRSKLLFRNK